MQYSAKKDESWFLSCKSKSNSGKGRGLSFIAVFWYINIYKNIKTDNATSTTSKEYKKYKNYCRLWEARRCSARSRCRTLPLFLPSLSSRAAKPWPGNDHDYDDTEHITIITIIIIITIITIREEISVLSSARREEIRRQLDEAERYRANPVLYIFNPHIRVRMMMMVTMMMMIWKW